MTGLSRILVRPDFHAHPVRAVWRRLWRRVRWGLTCRPLSTTAVNLKDWDMHNGRIRGMNGMLGQLGPFSTEQDSYTWVAALGARILSSNANAAMAGQPTLIRLTGSSWMSRGIPRWRKGAVRVSVCRLPGTAFSWRIALEQGRGQERVGSLHQPALPY